MDSDLYETSSHQTISIGWNLLQALEDQTLDHETEITKTRSTLRFLAQIEESGLHYKRSVSFDVGSWGFELTKEKEGIISYDNLCLEKNIHGCISL